MSSPDYKTPASARCWQRPGIADTLGDPAASWTISGVLLRGGAQPVAADSLSYAGLTRVSISLRQKSCEVRWMAGSSPAMTIQIKSANKKAGVAAGFRFCCLGSALSAHDLIENRDHAIDQCAASSAACSCRRWCP